VTQAESLSGSLPAIVASGPLEQKVSSTLADARMAIIPRIETVEQKQVYVTLVRTLKVLRDGPSEDRMTVGETFGPIKSKAHALHAEICKQEKKFSAPITETIDKLAAAVTEFDVRTERERQQREDEQRRQQEAIQRKARVDQLVGILGEQFKLDRAGIERRAKKINLDHPAAVDVEMIERLFTTVDAEAKQAKAKAETKQAADRARAYGEEELAKEIESGAIQSAPDLASPPPLPPAPAAALPIAPAESKVKGSYGKAEYSFRVVDPNLIPLEYHNPYDDLFDPESWPKIKRVVSAMKGRVSIPGIEAETTSKTIIRK
jgi:hypothetical protein